MFMSLINPHCHALEISEWPENCTPRFLYLRAELNIAKASCGAIVWWWGRTRVQPPISQPNRSVVGGFTGIFMTVSSIKTMCYRTASVDDTCFLKTSI